jgi:hypothetical protein
MYCIVQLSFQVATLSIQLPPGFHQNLLYPTVQDLRPYRPNPKSLTGDKVDSGIGLRSTLAYGLPMVNVFESTLEWT